MSHFNFTKVFGRRQRPLALRTCLIVAVLTVVAFPLALFWAWPHSRALQNEIDEVRDRHLLLARHVGAALNRYERDAKATFDFATDRLLADDAKPLGREMLSNLGFKSICMFEIGSGRLLAGHAGIVGCKEVAPEASLAVFLALSTEGVTATSGVHAGINGEPLWCLVRKVGNRIVVGALETSYFVELGKSIAFGKKGHAVIVDQTGRVLAHPIPAWEREMRDLSKIPVVQRMLAGEQGVATFYSPAFQDDMIAGFTPVPGTGWGVMVPQPMAELRETADHIKRSALLVFSAGLLFAALVASAMAWVLVRPLESVIQGARRMAAGEAGGRIEPQSRFLPKELRTLTAAFNVMARRVTSFNERLERQVADRTATAEQALADSRRANDRLAAEVEERSRIEAELRESNVALTAATQAKSEFLATMSHEIRTPMNGVLGMLGLLMKTQLGEKQRLYGQSAHRSAEALLTILNDVLDYSKLEAGRLRLEQLHFDLDDVLGDIIAIFKPAADAKSIGLDCHIAAETPRLLTGDPTRLRQILMNLAGNAVKFTMAGRVSLSATSRLGRGGAVRLRIEVKDTGIGIPPAAMGGLFTSFTQGDASIARKFGGTGLGLAISKQLIELMDGRIGVASAPGEGSTFWFEVDLRRAPAAATVAAAAIAAQPPPTVQHLHILVAEDNPVNQLVAEQVLLDAGHTVDLVANGREAVTALENARYDLVLMDIQMPEMDGITATRLIRGSAAPSHALPIVALTANAAPQDRAAYLAAGMDDVVAKPFADAVLLTAIAKVIAARRKAEAGLAAPTGDACERAA